MSDEMSHDEPMDEDLKQLKNELDQMMVGVRQAVKRFDDIVAKGLPATPDTRWGTA